MTSIQINSKDVLHRPLQASGRPVGALLMSGSILACGFAALFSGCSMHSASTGKGVDQYEQVVNACEAVLKENYYQTRVYRTSGHLVAYSQPGLEGTFKTRQRIDIHIYYENTGHYMPRVLVRSYVDQADPASEKGDPSLESTGFGSSFMEYQDSLEVGGHPIASEDWRPVAYDRSREMELRNAILSRLKIAA